MRPIRRVPVIPLRCRYFSKNREIAEVGSLRWTDSPGLYGTGGWSIQEISLRTATGWPGAAPVRTVDKTVKEQVIVKEFAI